jgi:multidrug transporter EmrE-like cation transporter
MGAAAFGLLLAGVALNAMAQLLLKAGTNAVGRFEYTSGNIVPVGLRLALEPHILGGMACYGVSLIVWIMGLSRVPVSIAYPMLSLGYVLNALAAWQFFGEPVGPQRMFGIGLIVLGVFVISRSGT